MITTVQRAVWRAKAEENRPDADLSDELKATLDALDEIERERDELLVHVAALVRAGTEARADAVKVLAVYGIPL